MDTRKDTMSAAADDSSRALVILNSIQDRLGLLAIRLQPVLMGREAKAVDEVREKTSPIISRLSNLDEIVESILNRLCI